MTPEKKEPRMGGFTVNLGSAGLAYTTDEGDQIISIKKKDLDAKDSKIRELEEANKRLVVENKILRQQRRKFIEKFIAAGPIGYMHHNHAATGEALAVELKYADAEIEHALNPTMEK